MKYIVLGTALFGVALIASAANIHVDFFASTPLHNDFVLEPARLEITVAPGEKITKNIYVTNRLGHDSLFSLSFASFTGSSNPAEGAVLVENTVVARLIHTPVNSFALRSGERATIPMTISVPKNQKPGELFIAVLVSGQSNGSSSGTHVVGRVGAMFFVRVAGTVSQKGFLQGFRWNSRSFDLVFKNDGSIHLNPYGVIQVRNMFGGTSAILSVDPWFVMPGFLRDRTITLPTSLWGGWYSASALINRGYDNQIDQKIIHFWVWPHPAIVFVGLLMIGGIIFIIKQLLLR